MIRVTDQTYIWVQHYDRGIEDLAAIEGDIAEEIAREIHIRLVVPKHAAVSPPAASHSSAHLALLQGRYFWNKRSQEGLRKSIGFLKSAIQEEPEYAEAHAALADSYLSLALIGATEPHEAFALAREEALRALRIDDRMSDASAALAYVRLYEDWDWRAAEDAFKRALRFNPSNSTAHQWYAEYLRLMGRQQEAIGEGAQALQLDPLSPIINTEAGLPYYFLGQYDNARAHFRTALELDPGFALARTHMGWSYQEERRYPEAISELETAARLDDSPVFLAFLGNAYGTAGRKQDAARVIETLQSQARVRFVAPTFLALVYAGLGDQQHEMDWLEKAYGERFWGLAWLKVERRFFELGKNKRFATLMERMRFP